MPGFFHKPIDRKTFLKTSMAMAAGFVANRAAGDESSAVAHVALLSDTHTPADQTDNYRGFWPTKNLQAVIPQVTVAAPQAAIINGDAARLTGEIADYQALKLLLEPVAAKVPIHIGLGNHDDRNNFFEEFPDVHGSPVADKHVSVFEIAGTRFVVLDSLLYVNKVAGLLGKAQRHWLTSQLPTLEKLPTVLFVHHTLGDGDGDLLDFHHLFEIVKPHRFVKAIFYGHSHRYHIEQKEHVYLINQPAIGYNFSDEQPVGWLDAKFSSIGVDLKLRAVDGNRTEDGQVRSLTW